jgi:hypothetical protein
MGGGEALRYEGGCVMFTYLHFGQGNEPRLTVKVEAKRKPLWWQDKGLSFTATGYGARTPSTYMIKWEGRWRRVYVACFGNAGTAYIGPSNRWLATVGEIEA